MAGNLAFQSGSTYVVGITPLAASTTNVTGTAALAGTVQANFGSGTFLEHTYTILTAAGGRNGTFDALATSGLPADFKTSLTYSGNTAMLNLTADLIPPVPPDPPTPPTPPLPVNQRNVAIAIDNFFNNGGALPPTFVSLFGLSGNNLVNALSQLSGEAATGAERVAFQLTDEFLNLMLDPFVDGRGGGDGGTGASALRRTKGELAARRRARLCCGVKAPPQAELRSALDRLGRGLWRLQQHQRRSAAIGSTNVTAQTYGFAAGMDYHVSPDTVVGFALAGGGTNWGLAQGLGGGRSDAFQVGAYATMFGPAYVAAAIAFANHWMTTSRSRTRRPAHREFRRAELRRAARSRLSLRGAADVGRHALRRAAGAGLSHAELQRDRSRPAAASGCLQRHEGDRRTATELGARFDDPTIVDGMPLILRARARLGARLGEQSGAQRRRSRRCPARASSVNGAAIPENSALTSAGAELL